jgi:hypothetical protein
MTLGAGDSCGAPESAFWEIGLKEIERGDFVRMSNSASNQSVATATSLWWTWSWTSLFVSIVLRPFQSGGLPQIFGRDAAIGQPPLRSL